MSQRRCRRCQTLVNSGRGTWLIVMLRVVLAIPLGLMGDLLTSEVLPIRYQCPSCGYRFRD